MLKLQICVQNFSQTVGKWKKIILMVDPNENQYKFITITIYKKVVK